jgi:hypothetical protein
MSLQGTFSLYLGQVRPAPPQVGWDYAFDFAVGRHAGALAAALLVDRLAAAVLSASRSHLVL